MGLQATSANSPPPSVEFVRFVLCASLHLSITICASFGEQKCLSTAVPESPSEIFVIAVPSDFPIRCTASPYSQLLLQFLANELWASAQTANASSDAPRTHNCENSLGKNYLGAARQEKAQLGPILGFWQLIDFKGLRSSTKIGATSF